MNKAPKAEKGKIVNAIIASVTPDQRAWLKTIAPALKKLKNSGVTPEQLAMLGPSDRIDKGTWDKIIKIASESLQDANIKQEVCNSLTKKSQQDILQCP